MARAGSPPQDVQSSNGTDLCIATTRPDALVRCRPACTRGADNGPPRRSVFRLCQKTNNRTDFSDEFGGGDGMKCQIGHQIGWLVADGWCMQNSSEFHTGFATSDGSRESGWWLSPPDAGEDIWLHRGLELGLAADRPFDRTRRSKMV